MNRGILATCYARPTGTETTDQLLAAMIEAYAGEPIHGGLRFPARHQINARLQLGSRHRSEGRAHRVGRRHRGPRQSRQGAAGQAVQCANLAVGIDETTGLPLAGMYP